MRRFQTFLALCMFALSCGTALGQAYPTHPIKIIYPFAHGAVGEVVLRMVAQRLGKSLRQPVIIENKPGAGHIRVDWA